jgi:hypothetical protein
MSLVMEVAQMSFVKFFVEEGVKRAEITDRVNKHYGRIPFIECKVLLDERHEIGEKGSFKHPAFGKSIR